jgi:hypothetical protein
MRLGGRVMISGFVFTLLLVLFFRGGSAIGEWTGHWHTSLTITDYMQLLRK